MSFNQYTNLNLNGHLALDLSITISDTGTINNLDTLDTSYLRFTGSNVTLTGLNPQYSKSNNKLLTILYAGSGTLIVSHVNILSTDGYRIYCPSSENITLNQNDTMNLIYDSNTSLWYVLSVSSNTGGLTNEPTGFPVDSNGEIDRTSSIISFNNTNRIFTIAPFGSSYKILIKGQSYVKTSSDTVTIPNNTGTYYIYFNSSANLTYTSNFDLEIIYKDVYVATVYWNSTQGKIIHFGDERHGSTLDGHTHARLHQRDGAVYISGSALNNFVVDGNGTSNTHTQFSIDSGQVRDEDILHILASKNSTTSIPVLYRIGTEWNSVENTNQKFHYNTRAYYNLNTGGSYSLSEVDNNKYCLYHIVSTNDPNNPYFSMMGINQYDTKPAAREGALNEISLYSGLPFVEFVFIATIIFESKDVYTNTGKSIIVSTDTGGNYIDWRFVKTLNPFTSSINTHNNLGGLQGGGSGNYYHSNQLINTDSNVNFNSITSPSITSNNVSISGTLQANQSILNNVNITGTLNTNSVNISQNLNVTGTSNVTTLNSNNENISGNLNVTGTSNLRTTNVNGTLSSTNISNSENISSNTTSINVLNGNSLNITGTSNLSNTNVSDTLNVTGTSTQSIVNMTTGNVSGNLNVTGTSNLTNQNVSGALNVTGTTTLTNQNVSGNLNVFGNTNLANTNINSLSVTGTSNLSNTNVSNTLNVTGIATLTTVNSSNNNITNNLNVSGVSTLSTTNLGDTTINGTLNVTGTSTLSTSNVTNLNVSSNLNVTGTTTLNTSNTTTSNISGNLNVSGTTTIRNLSASGITGQSLQIANINYPNIDGTNGQSIVTDGSGNLSFQTVSGGGGSSSVSTTFISTSVYPIGSPVYYSSSGWNLAIATSDITSVQYVISSISGSGTFTYTASSIGEITLTTNEWDVITNGSGGLASGTTYFLSSNIAGKITTSPGLLYAPVLRAISSTKAFISLSINNTESGMGDTFYRETTTTVANTSSITLSYPPAGKAYVWLSIDGVVQSGNDFNLSGNTITLGGTIPSNTLIDVLYARSVLLADSNAINKMVAFSETVTGSPKTTFNLPSVPSGLNSCIVFVGGAIQDTSKFNLSGNVLTMMDSVPIGIQLIAYILNSSGITNTIDSFVTRQTYSIPTTGTVNISTIFGSQVSGLYRFFDINDPRISGTISLKHNGVGNEPDIRVDSNSNTISIAINTTNRLNIYIASNLLTFQNNTSNTISLRIYREI